MVLPLKNGLTRFIGCYDENGFTAKSVATDTSGLFKENVPTG